MCALQYLGHRGTGTVSRAGTHLLSGCRYGDRERGAPEARASPPAPPDAALLVYDITLKESFDRVQHWVKELHRMVGRDIAIAIAGNKVDLERNRVVEEADVLQ